jgi:hypothetical protein
MTLASSPAGAKCVYGFGERGGFFLLLFVSSCWLLCPNPIRKVVVF